MILLRCVLLPEPGGGVVYIVADKIQSIEVKDSKVTIKLTCGATYNIVESLQLFLQRLQECMRAANMDFQELRDK